ncbi:Peptide methionine sulfoxide reductase MsrA/MsrB [Urinicoccus massiliensis]|uniref:Peptide methionine sulfoxide reductase MsrA n=1 Tax=Urinicoccus massiliensis TaxID=1723382 RepID=A0A8H2QYW5_9FIRM|nr:peptide-methionine (S)-S-oxide reductase MsrA [Urinicoccus massiliensis]VFB17174.1 Peptide methionine sulfoxide reductase MsrA/MsrB [Urinicoccus massiliensis]
MKKIVFAGGCFWGVQAYFKRIPGVLDSQVGYANGQGTNPDYQEVCRGQSGFAEAVALTYRQEEISLEDLIRHLFRIIDPTSLNRQGNDCGVQYRTGIYFLDPAEEAGIQKTLAYLAKNYAKPLQVEVQALKNFYPAEDYHQDYLDKNPLGYCHVDLTLADKPLDDPEEERKKLGTLGYQVLRENATEAPFSHPYYKKQGPGIFVDKLTRKPLFLSKDQYEPGCGWPSFTKPIREDALDYRLDRSHGMVRQEVRSRSSKGHLGHVFEDGPRDQGGLRYCINGAVLDFIPLEDMEKEGYGQYIQDLKELEEKS